MHTGTPPPSEIWPLGPMEAQLPHHTMLWVEGGSYDMGNDDEDAVGYEKIIHTVTLKSFCLARYPVTQALYTAVMGAEVTPSYFKGEDRPVEQVSWDDARQFIQRLNALTGRTNAQWRYCLPSESQWEYAARGGKFIENQAFKYAGSNKLKEVGWFSENSHRETKPVGLKQSNHLGLYDMTGNVWEWCEDDWHDSYDKAPPDGSAWVDAPKRGSRRVYRGGGWNGYPQYCRASCRNYWNPGDRYGDIGFRLCLASSEVDVIP